MDGQDTGAELAADIDAAFPQQDAQPAEVTCSGGITLHPMGAQA